jgi:hypothetical protein
MIDTKPFEWLLSNIRSFENDDQKRVMNQFSKIFFIPFFATYLGSSLLFQKLSKQGSYKKRLAFRFLLPTFLGAAVTDASYMMNFDVIKSLNEELKTRYSLD